MKLKKVSYVYSEGDAFEKKALDEISLEIPDGQFIGIIGHTGSGKSTLIQHLNGLLRATSGAIYYDGENIYQEGYDMRTLRSKVGLVFQYPEHQLFEVDVFSDVCFGPKNLGLSKEEVEERAKKALTQVGLDESYYKKSPFELSGGQKRRVAIAGILAMHPQVLILDEPTAGLDPKGRDEILDQVALLQKERKITVILVSHSMEDVARYVDRIIVVNDGKILFDDTPKQVFQHYKELESVGLAAPQVTYVVKALKEKGWDVPTTWDEMWELGDKAAAEGTYLFTYPTTGYFDAFFYALMYAAGGPDFFNKATHYEEGIWDTAEAQTCFDIVTKLASYTNPITPAQANDQDFTQNQQLVLDNKALFMPNGTWIVGEMAEAPRADGFEWGMTALPAVKAGGDQYSYTWFEQAWIPAGAEHLDAAKQFVAYLYSDEACKLFAESGAIQPVLGIADDLDGDNKMFYSIYDNGAKAAMGNFASFTAIPGVEVRTVFFDPVNSLVSGSTTEQQWIDGIKSASDQMRANIIE